MNLKKWGIMSKKIFSLKEIEILRKNKFVKNVTEKGITYSNEFKEIFVLENMKGVLPRTIFENHDFDIEIVGIERIKSSAKRWRESYKNEGTVGLKDTRKSNSGRPRKTELSEQEKLDRLIAENILLKAENELLKKLKMMEMGLLNLK